MDTGLPKTAVLSEKEARAAIESSDRFETLEPKIHLLEWQTQSSHISELLRIYKHEESDGLHIDVEILPKGKPYFRSAEYFAGGVVPVTLVQPLVRRVVEIKSIRDTDYDGMKEVSFAWDWVDVPDVLKQVKPELVDGPRPGTAWIQLLADRWYVIGNVRDFHTSL